MEKTIYESTHSGRAQQRNGIALGRIVQVDVPRRLCRVKTFLGPPHLLDLDCHNVQWADLDTNDKGDEMSSIPRVGSLGMVFFIEGESFIFGFVNAIQGKKGAVTGNETAKLVGGDKIIATRAGNRILVRANGSIEFTSKETLKTVYFPTDSRILELCRNYNFKADGGFINWEVDDTGSTKHTVEYRNNLARSMIMVEERGFVGGTTMYSQKIGPGVPGVPGIATPIYSKTYDYFGTTTEQIGPAALPTISTEKHVSGSIKHEIFSDYSILSKFGKFLVELDIGEAKILSKLGDILLEATAGHFQVHSGLDAAILSDLGDVDIEATTGAVKLNGSQAKLSLEKGKVALGAGPVEVIDQQIQQLDTLINNAVGLVLTRVGPADLSPAVVAILTNIKVALSTIKGSL